MKRIISTAAAMAAIAVSSACSRGQPTAPATQAAAEAVAPAPVTTGAQAVAVASAVAPAGSGAARAVKQQNDLYDFSYSYPAAAGGVPALKALLDADLNMRLGKLRKEAAEGRAEARHNGFPYNAYSFYQEWKIVTDLPDWLSLSAEFSDYSGGAHGNQWFGAMLWDKAANKPRKPDELFTSRAALARAIRAPFCDQLDQQRAAKRGEPVHRDSGDAFDKCIDPTREVVILGSRSGRAFDRIGVLVAPYSAGPYAEGAYEVTLPVTPAVIAAVRPQYRASFAVQP